MGKLQVLCSIGNAILSTILGFIVTQYADANAPRVQAPPGASTVPSMTIYNTFYAQSGGTIVVENQGVVDASGSTQPELLNDGTTIYSASGSDDENRTAEFDIAVISQEYAWKLESATVVVDMSGNAFDLVEYLQSSGLQERFAQGHDFIAIGAASCEGNREVEIRRAGRRAMTLTSWLRQVIPEPAGKSIYSLNLGRREAICEESDADATLDQRLVIIAWVRRQDTGVLLGEALYSAMQQTDNLRLHPGDYSSFRLRKST